MSLSSINFVCLILKGYSLPLKIGSFDFSFLTIFTKTLILDVCQDSEFAFEPSNDLRRKAPSQMFNRVLNSLLY